MFQYPVRLRRDDNNTLLVTFPDIPEAITFGRNRAEALRRAPEALEAALSIYMDKRLDIPAPSRPRSRRMPLVRLPALSEAKVALYSAMRKAGLRKADLARRLGWQKSQVDRLLDLNHASRLDQIEQALRALGKTLVLQIRDAA
ncbi:MAG TPA: type II toxin-antitoxin system HicB family antitoxin [Bryobacterales bacterium]|nr:type II toxin-antitoxin system HicB family antitoxin [Bryobacterales bacterium]